MCLFLPLLPRGSPSKTHPFCAPAAVRERWSQNIPPLPLTKNLFWENGRKPRNDLFLETRRITLYAIDYERMWARPPPWPSIAPQKRIVGGGQADRPYLPPPIIIVVNMKRKNNKNWISPKWRRKIIFFVAGKFGIGKSFSKGCFCSSEKLFSEFYFIVPFFFLIFHFINPFSTVVFGSGASRLFF